MDEHSAWNGWLLRHGRLTDALFSGLLVFGSFYLPATILYLLGTRRADWPFWVVLAVTLPVGAGVARYVLGPGHPASGESVPGTVRSQRRRLLLALGGALVALTMPLVWGWAAHAVIDWFPTPDPALWLLAGGASALWTSASILLLVPLGPPPPRRAPPLPWTGERIMGVGVLLLGLAVLLLWATGGHFLAPLPLDPIFLLGVVGSATLSAGFIEWRRERAAKRAPRE